MTCIHASRYLFCLVEFLELTLHDYVILLYVYFRRCYFITTIAIHYLCVLKIIFTAWFSGISQFIDYVFFTNQQIRIIRIFIVSKAKHHCFH